MKQVNVDGIQLAPRSYSVIHDIGGQLGARGRRVLKGPYSNQSKRYKYLAHQVQEPFRQYSDGPGRSDWSGRTTLGIIVLTLDYPGRRILGRRLDELTQRQMITLCNDLGLFVDAPERLGLSKRQRRRVAWSSNPQKHHYQNRFLCHTWQLIRMRETYPGLLIVRISLAEAVAQLEANSIPSSIEFSPPNRVKSERRDMQ